MPFWDPKKPRPIPESSITSRIVSSRAEFYGSPKTTKVKATEPAKALRKAAPRTKTLSLPKPKTPPAPPAPPHRSFSSTAPSARGSFGGVVGYRSPGSIRAKEGSTAYYEKFISMTAAEGLNAVLANLNKVIGKLNADSVDAALLALKPTFDLSLIYVPYDTGALYDSGRLKVDDNSRTPRVYIQYGGGGDTNVRYAALVHELTYLRHAAPTRSKYLQAAFEETQGEIYMNFFLAMQENFDSTPGVR